MKHLFKAAVVAAGILIVNMIINIICNRNGIDFNSAIQASMSAWLAVLIYEKWTRSEKDQDAHK